MPTHNNCSRGSQWNKWDLHVHTPASILNSEFGNDWDAYIKDLFSKAIDKQIVAIGITDYFSVKGYRKIREDYLNNDTKLAELFREDEIEKIRNILVVPN